ncbi:MAG: thioredoxin domain-containing protein [Solirubrobacteraceae bacterium]|nr:thioredoxin domain-containing protein [Solirubrobacteraceae bacterium]
MANALAGETSPYLLQHADNPVDWLPWGEEALRRARELDRPLLVSIGYAACHWCHVMERESFEDPQVAELMNARFVCVKVDREERPDVDAVCMEAVQAMTGHGGWPLNVFLTPEQVPFYGGTYFPPRPAMNQPSWTQVLAAVAEAWEQQRDAVREQARRLRERLAQTAALRPAPDAPHAGTLRHAVENLRAAFDARFGGWGGAPKFPAASTIDFLLGQGETEMAATTLRAMATGGIHDLVGGGFARYAVDRTWTVPHFEKMLYDNALLARAYLHGWQATGDELLRRTCRDTLDWMLAEMRAPGGGFRSSLDADSEGVEGRFYVWTLDELRDALGPDADAAIAWTGATARGNFEGANVLQARGPEPDPETRERIRARLAEVRARRVRPALDDKVLTSWNALAIAALAEAGAVLREARYLDAARTAAEFLLAVHRDADGRLLRTSKDGDARLAGYLEDHAFLVEALVGLYEATWEPRWLTAARDLADATIARFGDRERGGFFTTADDQPALVARRRDLEDSPIPSGSSSAALGLLRLHALTGEAEYERWAASTIALAHELAPRYPVAFGHLLQAIAWAVGPAREVAIVGPGPQPLLDVVRAAYRPRIVLAGGPGPSDEVPLLAGREPLDGRAAAYVCERFACRRPVADPDELAALLDG